MTRLYRILALRRLDLPLVDIKRMLNEEAAGVADVLARQVQQLDQEVQRATALRAHLVAMQDQLQVQRDPPIDDWLVALESMSVGPKYFSADEQRALQLQADDGEGHERAALTARLRDLVAAGASPETPEAEALSLRWMQMLLETTEGDEGLLMKLYAMHWNEPSLQALTGVDQAGIRFLSHAMAFARLARYAPHCTPDELATLRAHYVAQTDAWPPLIAELRAQRAAQVPPEAAAVQALALRWKALSLAKVGGDLALHANLQRVAQEDAALRVGSGIDAALAAYVEQALAHLDRAAPSEGTLDHAGPK